MKNNKKVPCLKCNDTNEVICEMCNGTGTFTWMMNFPYFNAITSCSVCEKTGKTSCPDCRGKKLEYAQ